jgi:6-phosphogluconolactonase
MANSDRITTYIGTYTRRESFVDGKGEGIYIYHLDPGSGELTHAATVTGPGTLNPSYVTLSPGGRCLYAINEVTGGRGPHGNVSAFAIDPVTGDLSYLNEQSSHGLAPCFLSVELEGRYCLVANYETGSVCVLPVKKDGSLGPATGTVQCSGSGPNRERQEVRTHT